MLDSAIVFRIRFREIAGTLSSPGAGHKRRRLSDAPRRTAGGLRGCEGWRRRLRPARLRRLLLKHAQPRHVFLVLVVTVGEGMAAAAVGDEIQFLGARRIGGGFE